MKTIIYICGAYSLIFALFHMGFWKMFGWSKDLKNLSSIEAVGVDRRIMHILNIQMIWCFLFVALVCFVFPYELMGWRGMVFFLGCSVFWLIRAIVQPIFLRGGLMQNIVFIVVFLIGAVLFATPVVYGIWWFV